MNDTLKLLVDLICYKAQAHMCLDTSFREVKYWTCLQGSFGDPKGSFHYPKSTILRDNLRRRDVGVVHIAFKTVPHLVLCNFLLTYAYLYIVLNF